MNSNIIKFTSKDSKSTIISLSKTKPTIVDFFATWCGPCTKLSPLLEKAAKENNLYLCVVDVDKNQDLAEEFGVSAIPHVFLFIEGKQVMDFTGCDTSKLNEMVAMAKKKASAFQGKGTALGGGVKATSNKDNTPIPEEPAENADDVYTLMFRYESQTFQRRFKGCNTIAEVKAYVRSAVKAGNIMIFTPFPRKVYDNDASAISESGLSKKEMLQVSLK